MHFSPPTLDCLAAALGPLACLAAALAPQPGLPNLTLTHPPFKRICQYFFLFLTKRVVAGPYMTPWGSPDFFSYKFPSQVETQWRGIQSILNKNRGGGGKNHCPQLCTSTAMIGCLSQYRSFRNIFLVYLLRIPVIK